jgi:hypothetical protein
LPFFFDTADPPCAQVCQHGKDECLGDRYEACAIGLTRQKKGSNSNNGTAAAGISRAAWEFSLCLTSDNRGKVSAAQACANRAGVDWVALQACAKKGSALGDALEIEMAKATNAPGPHAGVPWTFVNGKYVEGGMLKEICNAYTGTAPAGCKH